MKLLFAVLFCTFVNVTCFFKSCNYHKDCDGRHEFMCCLCSKPECLTDADCVSSEMCYTDGNCIGIRHKRHIPVTNITAAAFNEYNQGYICENDDDCEDGAFCFNGDCAPDFMKKEHARFKRGAALIPPSERKAPGFRCSCYCQTAPQIFPVECKKFLPTCEHDDDCRNDNSFCIDNSCVRIWQQYVGDNEIIEYPNYHAIGMESSLGQAEREPER